MSNELNIQKNIIISGPDITQEYKNELINNLEEIEKLINYTQEHLDDSNLTLKWISENYLYMNVNYVSRRFFQETNRKYSNYLMNLRVQRAKELFANNRNLTIQDVAEMVGSGKNPNYLSSIFKKCTGITPSVYIANLI
mgnify:CR=1 FL=1